MGAEPLGVNEHLYGFVWDRKSRQEHPFTFQECGCQYDLYCHLPYVLMRITTEGCTVWFGLHFAFSSSRTVLGKF